VNVCRSLFEKDKLLFAFVLTAKVSLDARTIAADELRFLLTGGTSLGEAPAPNPDPTWITDAKWGEMCQLETLADPKWRSVVTHVRLHAGEWRAVYDSVDPARQPFPQPFQDSLSSFQKMLVLRTIRLDKLIPAMSSFVVETFGGRCGFLSD
jgi:dynein heavy chain, axonemal